MMPHTLHIIQVVVDLLAMTTVLLSYPGMSVYHGTIEMSACSNKPVKPAEAVVAEVQPVSGVKGGHAGTTWHHKQPMCYR